MHTRRFNYAFSLLAGFTISACSAFFVPNVDDDGVVRCNTTEDCPDLDDNRHRPQCVFGEGQPESSDKVCSSAFAEINCDPVPYSTIPDNDFANTYADATSNQNKVAYTACADENKGKQGCAPLAGVCDAGLEEIDGVCDDPDALYPSINPSKVGGIDIAGQDVQDSFCRYYFCDESFVCDNRGSKPLCKPCDPNAAFGEGGCGTLYIQGAPSPVYTDPNAGNCNGSIDADDVQVGDAPMPLVP